MRIKSLGEIVRGSGIKRTETVQQGNPCVRYGELYTTYTTSFTDAVSYIPDAIDAKCKHFNTGDILMTLTGENKPDIAKAVAYLGNGSVAAGGDLAFWTAHGMNPLFLSYYLASPYAISRKVDLATGDIIVHISGEKLGSILLPVPPIDEQQRIVDKIRKAERFISEYARKEAELTQTQEAFPDRLKKSILQMATQGKLVPQDPADEPAEALLERIRAEKARLVKEGKIRKDKHESVIFRRDNSHYEKCGTEEVCIDDMVPFDLPDNWEWVHLKDIVVKEIKRGKSPKYTPRSRIMVFAQKCNVKTGGINMGLAKFLDEEAICKYPTEEYMLDGDIVINSTGNGTLGRIGVFRDADRIDQSIIVADSHVTVVRLTPEVCHDYIFYALKYYQPQLEILGAGSTNQTELKPATIADLYIPIPPIAEQERIASLLSASLQIASAL